MRGPLNKGPLNGEISGPCPCPRGFVERIVRLNGYSTKFVEPCFAGALGVIVTARKWYAGSQKSRPWPGMIVLGM